MLNKKADLTYVNVGLEQIGHVTEYILLIIKWLFSRNREIMTNEFKQS